MCFETQRCLNTGTLDHPRKAGRAKGRAPLAREHKWRLWLLLALKTPEGTELVAKDRMRARSALFDSTDVQDGSAELNLIPT